MPWAICCANRGERRTPWNSIGWCSSHPPSVDLSRVPDGVHRGSAVGYRGPVDVEVTVREGRIEAVRVVRHKEDRFLTALIDVPQHILEKQGVDRIDAVTGATISSEAVLNASAAALAGAAK